MKSNFWKFGICLTFGFLSFGSYCQSKGYSRQILSLEGRCNIPMFSGSFNQKYYYEGNSEMKSRREWLDYGANFNYGVTLSKRITLGASAGFVNFNVATYQQFKQNFTRTDFYYHADSIQFHFEQVGMNQFTIMPYIEVSHRNGISPIGLYHHFGVGFSTVKIQNGGYAYSVKSTVEDEEQYSEIDYYNFVEKWERFNMLTFQYGFGMRVSVTKNIGISYGVDYTLNFAMKPAEENFNSFSNDFFDYKSVYYNSRRERLFTMNLKAGIFYCL